jgi:protein ImuB
MSGRYLSLWIPRFTCDWLDRREPGMRLRPVAITAREKGGLVVTGCNHAALRAGVMIGMKLADAHALEPRTIAVDGDPVRDSKALDSLAEWCERFTPFAAIDPPDGLFLDITGCAHLFGGEHPLLTRILGSLQRIGYETYAAIADTPGTAWATARYATSADRPSIVIHETRQSEALAPLPVAALRISPETQVVLERLGLRRIGDLYPMKRAALAKRFGTELLLRFDQALGHLPEPISPRRPVQQHVAKELFAEPIATREAIEASTLRLLETLCTTLAESGRGVRTLELRWWRVDGETDRTEIGTSSASRAPRHLMRLLDERLDHIDPGFGIEALAVHAIRTDIVATSQSAIGQTDHEANLAALVDRLSSRFGRDAALRFAPAESWLPERAVRTVPAFAAIKARPWTKDRRRPLRLLARPEPVEVVAMLPDQPPSLLRWKGKARRIVHAEGPERLESEWWKVSEPARDYYRVEDQDGRRYWLYRAGNYTGDIPPRWYLHGLFA